MRIVIVAQNASTKFGGEALLPLHYFRILRSRQSPLVDNLVGFGHQFVDVFNRLWPGKIQAETLLVANARTQQALPAGVRGKIIELVENGVDFSVWRSDFTTSKQPDRQVQ